MPDRDVLSSSVELGRSKEKKIQGGRIESNIGIGAPISGHKGLPEGGEGVGGGGGGFAKCPRGQAHLPMGRARPEGFMAIGVTIVFRQVAIGRQTKDFENQERSMQWRYRCLNLTSAVRSETFDSIIGGGEKRVGVFAFPWIRKKGSGTGAEGVEERQVDSEFALAFI